MIQCLNIYYWDLLTVGFLLTVGRSGIFKICQRQSFSAKMHISFPHYTIYTYFSCWLTLQIAIST